MESPSESDAQVENIIVEKYEDCTSEEIATELTEDEQSGDQILGYLEVQGHNGSQDATIYLDSQGLNLNGKRLILTQNDEGIIVVVSNDSNGQPLEGSVIHSDSETLVVAETSESLEFINSESPQEDVYIENNGESQMEEESPLWSDEQTSKSTEMLFIPNPTVMLAPEETKHPKLMQLACIAHQLQSADTQKETPPSQEFNDEPLIDNTVSVIQSTSSNEHCNVIEKEALGINCANLKEVDSPTVVVHDGMLQSDEQIVDNNLETECTANQTNGDIVVETVDVHEDEISKKFVFKNDNVVVTEKNNSTEEIGKTTNSNLNTINQRTVPANVEKDNEYNFSENDDLEVILPPKKSYSPKKYSIFSSKSKVKTLFSTGTPSKVSFNKLEHDKPQGTGLSKDKIENSVLSPQKNLSEYDNPIDAEDSLVSDRKEIKKFCSLKARNLSRAIVAEFSEEPILHKDTLMKKDSVLELNDESLSKSSKSVIEDITEETHVKPPKKTYIRKKASTNISTDVSHDKIELFSVDGFSSCDKDIEQAELALRGEQEPVTNVKELSASVIEETSQALPSVGIKVSATYNRKKKDTVKQDRHLRRRLKKSAEKSTPDVLNKDSSSENIAWADVLLRTSFDNPGVPSPPHSQPSPRKQRKQSPKKCKPESAFDSLLLLSPKKHKITGNKKFISNIVKKAKSRLENRKSAWKDSSGPKVRKQGWKRARMRFTVRPKVQEHVHEKMDETNFCCSSCDFVSTLVNNLIEHLKYCEKRQPPLDYPVDDMERRQRIRGENVDNRTDNILELLSSGSFDAAAARGEYSGTPQNTYDSDDELYYVKNKFGYGEDDIVWSKVEDRFWPALVCKITEGTAFVMLVNYPTERKGLKKPADRLHTFHDAKWNKMLLMEAASLPHNEIFVKAVQTSETYVRKKWLGFNVKGKDFFSIPDEVVYTTDEESCDESNINEDSDFDLVELDAAIKPSRMARYKKLDLEKIKNYILKGNLDTYVLDIFHRRQSSQKHMKYFSEGRGEMSLTQRTWFGPCEKMFEQGILLDYFHSLFLQQIGERHYYLSYILQVWIPEVIVKAISETHRIPMKEAETLFESDDSSQAEGKEDPSMEAIEKLYS